MAIQASEGLLSPFLRQRRYAQVVPYLKGAVLWISDVDLELLCRYCDPKNYWGVERDEESLAFARMHHPQWGFQATLPTYTNYFDTVVPWR